jgi:hypothetical protein
VVVLTSEDGQTCLAALATGGHGRNESRLDVNRKFDARFLQGPTRCGTIIWSIWAGTSHLLRIP